jgi:hypothetical protein
VDVSGYPGYPHQRPPEDRPDRYCDSCHAYDSHPRHVHIGHRGIVTTYKHMHCCFNDGCPTRECDKFLRDSQNAHGNDLVTYLESLMPPDQRSSARNPRLN